MDNIGIFDFALLCKPSSCWHTRMRIEDFVGRFRGLRMGVAPQDDPIFTGPLSRIPESSELNCT